MIEPPCLSSRILTLENSTLKVGHLDSISGLQTVLHWSLLSRYCTLRSLCLNQGCSGQKYLWSLVASWGSRLFCIRHGYAIMPSQSRRASVASQEIYDLDKSQELDRHVDYDSMNGDLACVDWPFELARKANNQNYWQDLLAKAFELVVCIA